jgi:hypothetical protein
MDLKMAHLMSLATDLLLVGVPASAGACGTGELCTAMTAPGALAASRHIAIASLLSPRSPGGTYEATLTAHGTASSWPPSAPLLPPGSA